MAILRTILIDLAKKEWIERGMSVRACNVLKNLPMESRFLTSIRVFRELPDDVQMDAFLSLPNCGRHTTAEIMAILREIKEPDIQGVPWFEFAH